MHPSPVRPDFPTVSPYLIFRDAAKALAFYTRALGAVEISRHADPDGTVRHGEFRIEDSTFMLTQETPAFAWMRGIETIGESPVQFFLYVHDVEARFQRALDAGCTVVMPVAEQPYGRSGGVKDPFGHVWWLSTHKA